MTPVGPTQPDGRRARRGTRSPPRPTGGFARPWWSGHGLAPSIDPRAGWLARAVAVAARRTEPTAGGLLAATARSRPVPLRALAQGRAPSAHRRWSRRPWRGVCHRVGREEPPIRTAPRPPSPAPSPRAGRPVHPRERVPREDGADRRQADEPAEVHRGATDPDHVIGAALPGQRPHQTSADVRCACGQELLAQHALGGGAAASQPEHDEASATPSETVRAR